MGAWGRGRRFALVSCLALAAALTGPPLAAQPADDTKQQPATEAPPPVDEATQRGRDAYLRGVALSKQEQWGDALAAFEDSAAARDAPMVQYNIAMCQRALGRYVAASRTVAAVLRDPAALSNLLREDLEAFATEFDAVLVKLEITMEPKTARLTVDGRPLLEQGDEYLASVAPAGKGTSPRTETFTLVLDPGSHLFRATRPGHQPVVVQKSYRASQRAKLLLRLDEMPATVAIESEPKAAIVRVNDREVGLAPIEIERPAGRYSFEVVKNDFETYTAELDLEAGQRSSLTAKLIPYEEPIIEKWWFWTSIGAVVAGGVVLTYVLTRPEPEPPPYDGGSAGWVVTPQLLQF
ncbi:MAG: PEGA domain-containing protein [Deltaproteobacteria bacterium]|nr:MAG: PEGA domain-containing protein [Deltaproteobacteria bacterium]